LNTTHICGTGVFFLSASSFAFVLTHARVSSGGLTLSRGPAFSTTDNRRTEREENGQQESVNRHLPLSCRFV